MKRKVDASILKSKLFGLSISHILAILLVASIAGYVLTQSVFFAVLGFIFIIGLFFSDFSAENNLRQNALELVYALAFAVGAWLLLGFALHTDSPINVVTSCSMLPNLQRGDLVFIQGGVNNVQSVSVSTEQLPLAQLHRSLCIAGTTPVPCTDAIMVANKTIAANPNNDVIIFDPKPTGPGLIIHRAFARFDTEQGVFYATKGDNNPVLDQENGRFQFVSEKDVKGHVVLRVPYVGYLKLLLFLQFDVPQGCDTVLRKA